MGSAKYWHSITSSSDGAKPPLLAPAETSRQPDTTYEYLGKPVASNSNPFVAMIDHDTRTTALWP